MPMPKTPRNERNKKTAEYLKSLEGATLDSSDVLLLSIEIVKDKIDISELEDLKKSYIERNYDKAKTLLLSLLKTHEQLLNTSNPALVNIIKAAIAKTVDTPEKNVSRRYFETKFSADMWESLNEKDFKAINDLLLTISRINASEPNEKMKLQGLPLRVTNKEEAYLVISRTRELGDNNSSILAIRTPLRRESPLPKIKDRWDDNSKPGTQYSMNPGIMQANNPMPADERLDPKMKDPLPVDEKLVSKKFKNRTTDTYYINRGIEGGFSATRENIPFVNSLSGTAFSMVSSLKLYLEDQKQLGKKSPAELNNDANSIVQAFLGYMCMDGYHSLGEMTEVLKEPAVKNLLAEFGVSIHLNLTSNDVNNILQGAAFYCNELLKRQIVQTELRKSPMTFLLDDKKSKGVAATKKVGESPEVKNNKENINPNSTIKR
jgi:hypothetical protein